MMNGRYEMHRLFDTRHLLHTKYIGASYDLQPANRFRSLLSDYVLVLRLGLRLLCPMASSCSYGGYCPVQPRRVWLLSSRRLARQAVPLGGYNTPMSSSS